MHTTTFGNGLKCLAAVLVLLATQGKAANRCTMPDGKVMYQDAPCPVDAGASRVRLFTPPSDPAGRQRAAAELAAAANLAKASEVVPAQAVGMGRSTGPNTSSSVAALANACLNYYRPTLRDPASAYWSGASLDKLDVLRMTLHATNGYGGFVAKTVGCEVRDGQIDVSRTRSNADRLGM